MRKVLGCALLLLATAAAADERARAWIARMEDNLRADTSIARYTMRIVRPDWTRTLRFVAWDDRKGKRLFIHILAPPKERDTTWLKIGTSLWMYLPRLEREIRIPPAMMSASWMGSDFTNDDLVKMESLVTDYEHTILARKGTHILVQSIPKPDAAVVWGKIETELDTQTALPVKARYYDEQGVLVRTIFFKEPRRLGGRLIPTRWLLVPADAPNKRTELVIEDARFDVPIPDARFSRARLRHP